MKIDLRGPNGNAHYVLGVTERMLKAMGKTPEQIEAVTAEAMSGDYLHLLDVCQQAAGHTYIGRKRATR
jgi:hypothetical protein